MSTSNDAFERYIVHVREGLEAIAETKASSSAYHEGTAQLVRQAMDLAQRRFDRIAEDYRSLAGEALGVPGSPDPADPADAERAEDLLAEAGGELRALEQLMEASRVALPLWAQVHALSALPCDHAHYVAWRDPVRETLTAAKGALTGEDPRAIESVTEQMRGALGSYRAMRDGIDKAIDDVSDTLRRSGSLTRSSERAVDAAFRRSRTGRGRAFKNGMSGAVIVGAIGYVGAFIYGMTQADLKGAEVAKPFGMLAAGAGFLIGLAVGWYRFIRPAKEQIAQAEAKQVRAEKAIEEERARLDGLKAAAKALPYEVAPMASTESMPDAPSEVPSTENNAAAIAAALDAELG